MRRNINTKTDIKFLVDAFYGRVRQNEIIGHFFNSVAEINWDKHMPVMYQFWETVLLDKMTYRGNPMSVHIALNQKSPLKNEHFKEWLRLWNSTVNEHFEGEIAELAINKAEMLARLMQFKIEQSKNPHFIQ